MADAIKKLSVLVIDDDMVMRELLVALLESEGQPVAAAESQQEAMDLLSIESKPDAVLMDLHLPDTDVHELIAQVRNLLAPRSVLLGMSGSEPEAGVRGMLDGFLPKPFSLDDLYEAVEHAKKPADPVEEKTEETLEPQVPVLDMGIYQRLASSLPIAKLHELYDITVQDVQHRTELIRAAAEAGDTATCRSEAHAIKGGCGMVGAMELRALAMGIEAGVPPNTSTLHQIAEGCHHLRRMLDTLTR